MIWTSFECGRELCPQLFKLWCQLRCGKLWPLLLYWIGGTKWSGGILYKHCVSGSKWFSAFDRCQNLRQMWNSTRADQKQTSQGRSDCAENGRVQIFRQLCWNGNLCLTSILSEICSSNSDKPRFVRVWNRKTTLWNCFKIWACQKRWCVFQWARELGQQADRPVRVPLHPCEHFYIVTKPMENVDRMMPGKYFRTRFISTKFGTGFLINQCVYLFCSCTRLWWTRLPQGVERRNHWRRVRTSCQTSISRWNSSEIRVSTAGGRLGSFP